MNHLPIKGVAGLFQKNIAKQLVLQTDIPLKTYNIHSVRGLEKNKHLVNVFVSYAEW